MILTRELGYSRRKECLRWLTARLRFSTPSVALITLGR